MNTLEDIDKIVREKGLYRSSENKIKSYLLKITDNANIQKYLDYRYKLINSIDKPQKEPKLYVKILMWYVIGILSLLFHFYFDKITNYYAIVEMASNLRHDTYFGTVVDYGILKYVPLVAGLSILIMVTMKTIQKVIKGS